MKCVLDSCVAFKWMVSEVDSAKANRLRSEFLAGLLDFVAPSVFQHELAHAMTRAERQGRVHLGQAGVFWLDIMSTPPAFPDTDHLIPRAIEISSQMRIGFYDCLYVALAELEGCELVTADQRMITLLQPVFPFIIPLDSFP